VRHVEWRYNVSGEPVVGMKLYSSTMDRWFTVTDCAGAPPMGALDDSFSAHVVEDSKAITVEEMRSKIAPFQSNVYDFVKEKLLRSK
jgi:hypothetical protein